MQDITDCKAYCIEWGPGLNGARARERYLVIISEPQMGFRRSNPHFSFCLSVAPSSGENPAHLHPGHLESWMKAAQGKYFIYFFLLFILVKKKQKKKSVFWINDCKFTFNYKK